MAVLKPNNKTMTTTKTDRSVFLVALLRVVVAILIAVIVKLVLFLLLLPLLLLRPVAACCVDSIFLFTLLLSPNALLNVAVLFSELPLSLVVVFNLGLLSRCCRRQFLSLTMAFL